MFVTTTATYTLTKYSRFYSSAVTTSSSQANTNTESEWQHFVNPIIKVFLDAKKSSMGELISIRLRIIWTMYDGSDVDVTNTDQREIVFVRHHCYYV